MDGVKPAFLDNTVELYESQSPMDGVKPIPSEMGNDRYYRINFFKPTDFRPFFSSTPNSVKTPGGRRDAIPGNQR